MRIGVHLARFHAHDLVVEDGGEGASQVPGLEEGTPVNVGSQLTQVVVLEYAAANELGLLGGVGGKVGLVLVGAGFGQRHHGRGLLVGMLLAYALVIGVQFGNVGILALGAQQLGAHAHGTRGIGHIHHGAAVVGRNFHGRVNARASGPADQQGNLARAEVFVALHLGGHVLHFLQRGGDQARQANDVGANFLGFVEDVLARHHHAHVHHFEVVALQDHGHDVLADVMHVALHGGDHDLAFAAHIGARRFQLTLFFFDVGHQMGHSLLHHAGGFHHLRQEHLARAKQVAHGVHAGHQRAFDHVQGAAALGLDGLVALFRVGRDEFSDALNQGVAQTLLNGDGVLRGATPGQFGAVILGCTLDLLGHGQQALGRCQAGVFAILEHGLAIQHHVFDQFAQMGFQLVVHTDHAGVDNAHVHACLNGVVQEHGVDGFAHGLVAAEAERHVRHTTRHLGARQVLLDPAGGLNEVDRVVVVFFNAGGNGEDIGVEDDVFGREAHIVDQDSIGALADLDLALIGVCLTDFVKRHDHGGRAIALDQLGLVNEVLNAFLQGDGVDDALALNALQACFDHVPLRRVDHDRHTSDFRLAGDQVQETHHGGLAVEHGFVHVDVDDLGAVFDLLACNRQRIFEAAFQDHAGKGFRARHVGALAHVDEQRALANVHRLQA